MRSKVAAIGLGLVVAACTLTRTSYDECTSNADCRSTFGGARVCGGDGLCASAPPAPRCTTTFPADVLTRPESYPGAILVGVLMDRSLEAQRARENAVRLAVTQVNEAKGFDGKLFGAIFCDIAENTQYDSLKRTDAAITTGTYLADVLGVKAIIGPSSSDDAPKVFDAIKALDVILVSPAATSTSITGYDTKTPTDQAPGLLWRTAVPDTLQGEAIARHLKTLPDGNIVIVKRKSTYGDALTTVLTQSLKEKQIKVFDFETTGERDAAVKDAGDSGAKYVVFVSSLTTDAIAFINAVPTIPSYATTNLFLTDSAANIDLLSGTTMASAVYSRVTGSRPTAQGSTYELFRTSFTAAFRQEPSLLSYVQHSYDAAWLVFYGIGAAQRRDGQVTGAGIARALRKVSDKGKPETPIAPKSWPGAADALGKGETINVTGASGPLDYDPATEEATGVYDIWNIKTDGKSFGIVSTIDPTK